MYAEWLNTVRYHPMWLGNAPMWIRNAPSIVVEACEEPNAIQFVGDLLKNDANFAYSMITKHNMNARMLVQHVDAPNDCDVFVRFACKHSNGKTFTYASERLRNSVSFLTSLIHDVPMVLRYAKEEFKDDKSIVEKAIWRDGRVLRFASERLKDDAGLVRSAITDYPWAIVHASERLRDDKTFVMSLKVVERIDILSGRLRDDADVVTHSLQSGGEGFWVLRYVCVRMWTRSHSGGSFFAVHHIHCDFGTTKRSWNSAWTRLNPCFAQVHVFFSKEFMLHMVKRDTLCLRFASVELRDDPDVACWNRVCIQSFVGQCGVCTFGTYKECSYVWVFHPWIRSIVQVILLAAHPRVLRQVPDDIRFDKSVVVQIVHRVAVPWNMHIPCFETIRPLCTQPSTTTQVRFGLHQNGCAKTRFDSESGIHGRYTFWDIASVTVWTLCLFVLPSNRSHVWSKAFPLFFLKTRCFR